MSSSALQETGIWREASGALPFLPEGGRRGRFALALALAAALELGLVAYLSGREVILAPEPNNPHPMEVHAVTLPAPLPQLQAVPHHRAFFSPPLHYWHQHRHLHAILYPLQVSHTAFHS